MLGQLGQSIKGMRELGHKAAIVNHVRQNVGPRKAQMAMQSRFEGELPPGMDGSGFGGGMFA